MKRFALIALCLFGLAGFTSNPQDLSDQFTEAAKTPPTLRIFLQAMPKGADLHTHLSGATYAEGLIRAGAAAGNCYDPNTLQAQRAPCPPGSQKLTEALADANTFARLVDHWSMRDFVATSGWSGHDQFFASFDRFRGAAPETAMLREVTNRAGAQRMRHIEPMITFQGGPTGTLADRVNAKTPWTGDFAAFQQALLAEGLADLARQGATDAAALIRQTRDQQRCDTAEAEPGCAMSIRFVHQVLRTAQPWRVFTQALFAALLQRESPLVGGLNFVAPEDNPIALRDYTPHMRMIAHVRSAYPETRIALHAGELRLGLVPPEDLTFHIRQAVEIAGAHRIGHGVAIAYETGAFDLLRLMAERRVAVEINLTSNEQILGVAGPDHPFPLYRANGVPLVISTDDEGVARIDRTHEIQRAVSTFGLGWHDVVTLERNTLEYAFLSGESLWIDPVRWRMRPACADSADPPTPTCAAFLRESDKARAQWSLERALRDFTVVRSQGPKP